MLYIPPNEPLPFVCQVKTEKKHKANYSESCCNEDFCNEYSKLSLPELHRHNLSLLPDKPGKDIKLYAKGETKNKASIIPSHVSCLVGPWNIFLFTSSTSRKLQETNKNIFTSYVNVLSSLSGIEQVDRFISVGRRNNDSIN